MGTVHYRLEADADAAQRGFDKLTDKVRQLERKLKEVGRSSKTQGSRMKRSFGSVVMVMGSLQGGIDKVTEAFRFMDAEAARGAETIKKMEEGAKRLIQVSTSATEFRQLMALSKSIALTGIEPTLAQGMVFGAKSQGLLANIPLFARSAQFMDPLTAITSVGKFKSAFGEAEAGTSRELLNKFLRAAHFSDVTVDEIAKASVIAAQPASRLGGSDEELLAFMSVLSPAFKSPETAAFRIARFSALAERGTVYSKVSPAAQAARDRLKSIGVERGGIAGASTGIARTREEARIAHDEAQTADLAIQAGRGRPDRFVRMRMQQRDVAWAKRATAWRKEELALDKRNDALEEEAEALKERAKATKIPIVLKGQGLMHALRTLKGLTPEVRKMVLGESIQGAAAYQAMLVNEPAIAQRMAEVGAAAEVGPDDPFARRFAISMTDRDLRQTRRTAIAETSRNFSAAERRGRRRQAAQEMVDRIVEESENADEPVPLTWWRHFQAKLAQVFSGDPSTIRWHAAGGTEWEHKLVGDRTQENLDDVSANLERLIRALEQNTAVQEGRPAPNPNAGDLD
jgi:hypothetical protein